MIQLHCKWIRYSQSLIQRSKSTLRGRILSTAGHWKKLLTSTCTTPLQSLTPENLSMVTQSSGLMTISNAMKALQWRHNDHDSVSNHQPHGWLLNRLFRRWSKKTSKLRVTGLCVGNSPGPVNSPHKWPVTRKMFPFDDVIMVNLGSKQNGIVHNIHTLHRE